MWGLRIIVLDDSSFPIEASNLGELPDCIASFNLCFRTNVKDNVYFRYIAESDIEGYSQILLLRVFKEATYLPVPLCL